MSGVRGKNLVMGPTDQVGLLQNGGEGYATPASVAAVLAPLSVSMAPGNQLAVSPLDGLLYINTLAGADIVKAGYTLTYAGPSGSVTWDDGKISADAGNTLSRGTDGGLFVGTDAVGIGLVNYEITHTALDGTSFTWHDGRISGDAGNALVRGSDGGLFVAVGGGSITKVSSTLTWTDGVTTIQWEDGCVSSDANNAIVRGTDNCLFAYRALLTLGADNYTLTFDNGATTLTFANGALSADAGNILSRGTDGGLFLPADSVTIAADTFTFTHTSVSGAAVSWEDGRISGDVGNMLVRGSDGGLYVNLGTGSLRTRLTIYIDTAAGSDTNDGLTTGTPVQTLSGVASVVSTYADASHVTVYLRGAIASGWGTNTVFLPHQHVELRSWDTNVATTQWAPDDAVFTVTDIQSLLVDYGACGVLTTRAVPVHLSGEFRGRVDVSGGGDVRGDLFSWVAGAVTSGFPLVQAATGSVVSLSTSSLTADIGDAALTTTPAIAAAGGSRVSLHVGSASVTMRSAQSPFISVQQGGFVSVSGDSLTVTGSANDIEFIQASGFVQVQMANTLALSLSNGALNRIMRLAAGHAIVTAAVLDASIGSDASGMFRLTGMSLAELGFGVVTNSFGVATGDVLACLEGSDFRIWGRDTSNVILDRDVLQAALGAAGPGVLGPSATARIGDTYYTPTNTAAY